MLAKGLIPIKFISGVVSIIMSGILMATANVYPSQNNTTNGSFIAGCALVIVFAFIQIIFTFIGINIYNTRIHFQNMIFNIFASGLLIWFIFANWPKEYIWYIWGFLSLYPFSNELVGLISVMCHNKKIVFEKYRSEN